MTYTEKVLDFKGHDPAETGRSFTYKIQRVGTGDDAGASYPATRAAITPGSLVASDDAAAIDGTVYVRTDISAASGIPLEIRSIAGMCWTEAVYTAHEAKLRG